MLLRHFCSKKFALKVPLLILLCFSCRRVNEVLVASITHSGKHWGGDVNIMFLGTDLICTCCTFHVYGFVHKLISNSIF